MMSLDTGQTSSKLDTRSEELQLAVLTQENILFMHEILPFKIAKYQHQDGLNLLPNTAKKTQIPLFCNRATVSPHFTGQVVSRIHKSQGLLFSLV